MARPVRLTAIARVLLLHNSRADIAPVPSGADFPFQFKDQSRPWTCTI
jgi:hypothetical protein